MRNEHKYRVVAWWSSARTGIAKSESAPNAIQFTAPQQFGGLEGRWTPEELLMTSLASCFTTTFHAVATSAEFEYADLEVEAEGTITRTNSGFCFSEIVVKPNLTITSEENREQAISLLHRARALCLVSRALVTSQRFETRVQLSDYRHSGPYPRSYAFAKKENRTTSRKE